LLALLISAGFIIAKPYPVANATDIRAGDASVVSKAMLDARKIFTQKPSMKIPDFR